MTEEVAVSTAWMAIGPKIREAIKSRKGNPNDYSYDLDVSDIFESLRKLYKAGQKGK